MGFFTGLMKSVREKQVIQREESERGSVCRLQEVELYCHYRKSENVCVDCVLHVWVYLFFTIKKGIDVNQISFVILIYMSIYHFNLYVCLFVCHASENDNFDLKEGESYRKISLQICLAYGPQEMPQPILKLIFSLILTFRIVAVSNMKRYLGLQLKKNIVLEEI